MLHDDCRLTVDEFSAMFPQISRSLLQETITETFRYRKLSMRWVLKQLTDQHKLNRIKAGQAFLRCYKLHGNEFLCAFYLFTSLKLHMGGKRFSTEEEVKGQAGNWTKVLAGNYFEEGIKKINTPVHHLH